MYLVYKITNIKNQKNYVGCHITNDINDGYMGSGFILKKAVNKHGVENFRKEILCFCNSEKEMFDIEKQMILASKPEYNLHEGGNGGWGYIIKHGLNNTPKQREDSRTRMKYAREVFNEMKLANPNLTKEIGKRVNKKRLENIRNGITKPSMLGKNLSEEHKRKIGEKNKIHQRGVGNSQFGKPRDEETKRKISNSLKEYWKQKNFEGE